MPFVKQSDLLRGSFVCGFGKAGVGKTSLLREFPLDEMLIIDTDGGGTRTLAMAWGMKLPDDSVFVPSSYSDLDTLILDLWKDGMPNKRYIVLDTISTLAHGLVFERARSRQALKGKRDSTIEIQDYGQASNEVRILLESLKRVSEKGRHVIVFAHEFTSTRTTPDGTEKTVYIPSIIRIGGDTKVKGLHEIGLYAGKFDVIFRMAIRGDARVCLCDTVTEEFNKNHLAWPNEFTSLWDMYKERKQ